MPGRGDTARPPRIEACDDVPLILLALSCAVTAAVDRSLLKKALPAVAAFALGAVLMFSQAWGMTHGLLPALASSRSPASITGRVVSPPVSNGKSTSFFVETESVAATGLSHYCREKVLVRFDGPADESSITRVCTCRHPAG